MRRGVVAKCDRCLKVLKETSGAAGRKRKRPKNLGSGEEVRERAKKKKYSEDSSAEEDEVCFREAGVMKVWNCALKWYL